MAERSEVKRAARVWIYNKALAFCKTVERFQWLLKLPGPWRVEHNKIFEPPKDGPWDWRFFRGWAHYGWTWRWKCEPFKTVFIGTLWVEIGKPRTVAYPAPFMVRDYGFGKRAEQHD